MKQNKKYGAGIGNRATKEPLTELCSKCGHIKFVNDPYCDCFQRSPQPEPKKLKCGCPKRDRFSMCIKQEHCTPQEPKCKCEHDFFENENDELECENCHKTYYQIEKDEQGEYIQEPKKCSCETFRELEDCNHIGNKVLEEVGFEPKQGWEKEFTNWFNVAYNHKDYQGMIKLREGIKQFIADTVKEEKGAIIKEAEWLRPIQGDDKHNNALLRILNSLSSQKENK